MVLELEARLSGGGGIKASGDRLGQAKRVAQNKKQCGLFQVQARDVFLVNGWN